MRSLIFSVVLIAAWQCWAAFTGSVDFTPLAILETLARDTLNGRLIVDSAMTLWRLIAGTAVGSVLGVVVGYAMALHPLARAYTRQPLLFLAQWPPIVWTPFVIAIAGIADFAKIAIVSLCAFFIWFPAQMRSIENIDPDLMEVTKAYGIRGSALFAYVYVPATFPALADALRTSIVFGWVILVAAELIGSSNGLGWYVWDARNFGRDAEFGAGLLVIGVLGSGLTFCIDRVVRRMTPWKR
jgi:ABC-type nitrate/sulfonate/bicarbonate transport system permease component